MKSNRLVHHSPRMAFCLFVFYPSFVVTIIIESSANVFFPLLPSFVWCHLLTMSGRASSGSIYTPHRARLLKMPLFPIIITFWHHTDMSRPQSIFRFPHSVLLGVIYEYNSLDLCVCFAFAGKCGFCTKNKSCISQKHTANDLHNKRQDKTKTSQGRHLHIFFLLGK